MAEPFAHLEKAGRIATPTFMLPDVRNAIGTHQDCHDKREPKFTGR